MTIRVAPGAEALAGEVLAGLALQASPDLILGAVFLWWASGA
jgi:hypothetical protein